MKCRLAIGILLAFCHGAPARQLARADVGGGLTMPYYVSAAPRNLRTIFISLHGYGRDADHAFAAAAQAAAEAGVANSTLIVAPVFEVAAAEARAGKCVSPRAPGPAPLDALWKCGSWSDGRAALNGNVTSFAAMDRLIGALVAQHPGVRHVTLAGFSAGGQFVQRYVGFANPPAGVAMRYVVSDPSDWLYFDTYRPLANDGTCSNFNQWKLGLVHLPADLGRNGDAARQIYAAADVRYLEGALDSGHGPGTGFSLLAKGCGPKLQGRFRLDRGENFAAYDKAMLAHGAHTLTVVPGCGHDVQCVFPAPAALPILFGK